MNNKKNNIIHSHTKTRLWTKKMDFSFVHNRKNQRIRMSRTFFFFVNVASSKMREFRDWSRHVLNHNSSKTRRLAADSRAKSLELWSAVGCMQYSQVRTESCEHLHASHADLSFFLYVIFFLPPYFFSLFSVLLFFF